MSFLSENVVPGKYGTTFGTDAKKEDDLKKISKHIEAMEGILDVQLNDTVYPREFTIHTTALVKVEAIEQVVKKLGFHVIPKEFISI